MWYKTIKDEWNGKLNVRRPAHDFRQGRSHSGKSHSKGWDTPNYKKIRYSKIDVEVEPHIEVGESDFFKSPSGAVVFSTEHIANTPLEGLKRMYRKAHPRKRFIKYDKLVYNWLDREMMHYKHIGSYAPCTASYKEIIPEVSDKLREYHTYKCVDIVLSGNLECVDLLTLHDEPEFRNSKYKPLYHGSAEFCEQWEVSAIIAAMFVAMVAFVII